MIDEMLNELSCKIFFEADPAQCDVTELLAEGATLEVSSGPSSSVIKSAMGELELRRNEDRDKVSAQRFPDGFLHFQYVLEFYRRPAVKHEEVVDYIARLLDLLWSRMFPAVASCDYENELPHHGGYKDASLPWPSALLSVKNDDSHKGDIGIQERLPVSPYSEQYLILERYLRIGRRRAAFATQNGDREAELADQYKVLNYASPEIETPRSSPIKWLLRYYAASPFTGAPERAKELRKLTDELQIRLDFVDDLGGSCSVDLETHQIRFSLAFAEKAWAYSYSYLEIIRLWQVHGPGSLIDIPEDIRRLLVAAHDAEIGGNQIHWLDDFPKPLPSDEPGSASHAATELSLVVSSFVLLHEIGHIALGHKPDDPPTRYIEQEYQADDWASEWLLGRWREFGDGNDPRVYIKRTLGGMVWIGHLAGLEAHHRRGGGITHPDPPDRLLHFLDRHVPQSSNLRAEREELVWYAAHLIVQLHLEASGRAMLPEREFQDAREFLVAARVALEKTH